MNNGLLHTAIVHIPGGTGNGLSLSLGCSSPLDALVNVFNGRCKHARGRLVIIIGAVISLTTAAITNRLYFYFHSIITVTCCTGCPHDLALLRQPSVPDYLSFLSVAWGLVSAASARRFHECFHRQHHRHHARDKHH